MLQLIINKQKFPISANLKIGYDKDLGVIEIEGLGYGIRNKIEEYLMKKHVTYWGSYILFISVKANLDYFYYESSEPTQFYQQGLWDNNDDERYYSDCY